MADEAFEKEIFKAATEIINVVKNDGQISNVGKFVPERADLIIEHFKKYFPSSQIKNQRIIIYQMGRRQSFQVCSDRKSNTFG